jgi:hypothetical protein
MDRREAEGQPWIPRWQFEWRRTFAGRTSQRTPPLYRGYDRLPGGRDVMTRRRLMSVGLLLLILVASSCIRLVKDIARGPNGSDPSAPTVVSEVLYFVADDESRGSEIWRSDGTEAGTVLVPLHGARTASGPGVLPPQGARRQRHGHRPSRRFVGIFVGGLAHKERRLFGARPRCCW